MFVYKYKVGPETLVFVLGGSYQFLRYFYKNFSPLFCACFSTPFSDSAQLLLIESHVAVQVPIQVHICLPHMVGDDMIAWFGYHPPGTH